MKKEQTEEQVQDHLQEETGGGSSQPKVEKEETKGNKAIVWITIAVVVAFAIAVLLII